MKKTLIVTQTTFFILFLMCTTLCFSQQNDRETGYWKLSEVWELRNSHKDSRYDIIFTSIVSNPGEIIANAHGIKIRESFLSEGAKIQFRADWEAPPEIMLVDKEYSIPFSVSLLDFKRPPKKTGYIEWDKGFGVYLTVSYLTSALTLSQLREGKGVTPEYVKCAGHAVMLTGESPERTLMAGIS